MIHLRWTLWVSLELKVFKAEYLNSHHHKRFSITNINQHSFCCFYILEVKVTSFASANTILSLSGSVTWQMTILRGWKPQILWIWPTLRDATKFSAPGVDVQFTCVYSKGIMISWFINSWWPLIRSIIRIVTYSVNVILNRPWWGESDVDAFIICPCSYFWITNNYNYRDWEKINLLVHDKHEYLIEITLWYIWSDFKRMRSCSSLIYLELSHLHYLVSWSVRYFVFLFYMLMNRCILLLVWTYIFYWVSHLVVY